MEIYRINGCMESKHWSLWIEISGANVLKPCSKTDTVLLKQYILHLGINELVY